MTATTDPLDVPKIETGPNETTTFTNMATIHTTPEELIIHFGLRKDDDPVHGVGVARIYLTLPHAKRLAAALLRVIRNYERSFGEVIADVDQRLTDEGRQLFGLEQKEAKAKND